MIYRRISLNQITPSHAATLRSMTPHFQTYPSPRRPLPPEEEYLAGDLLVPPRDYLLYSRLHLPTLHLSALASTKLSTNLQGSLAFMHSPGTLFRSDGGSSGGSGSAGSGVGSASSSTQQQSGPTFPPSPPANLLLSLQQDHGRWATEYTYSAKDGMVGLRGLWNFGLTEEMLRPTALDDYPIVHKAGPALPSSFNPGEFEGKTDDGKRGPLVDQEDSSENGLRGRFSAGGEIYFSVKQRSLGCESDVVGKPSACLADRDTIRLALPQCRPGFASQQYPTRPPTRPHPYPHLQPLPSSTTL
jgi:distribution and morphology protein 10